MIKNLFLIGCCCIMSMQLSGQMLPAEFEREINSAKNDSALVQALDKISSYYREQDRASAIRYVQRAISLCEKNGQLLMKLKFRNLLANQMLGKQQFSVGYSLLNSILDDAKKVNGKNSTWLFYPEQNLELNLHVLLAAVHYNLQILMQQTSNWKECMHHLNLVRDYANMLIEPEKSARNSQVIAGKGYAYLRQQKLDSALLILNKGESNPDFTENVKPFLHMILGSVYAEKREYDNSKVYLKKALFVNSSRNTTTRSAFKLSQVYQLTNNIDSAYFFARMLLDTLIIFGSANYEVDLGLAYNNLYQCFKLMNKKDSAYKYVQLALRTSDSLSALRIQNLKEFQQMSFAEQKRLEVINAERKNRTIRWVAYTSIAFAALVALIAIIINRNARLRKKTNSMLLEQKLALEETLEQLKATQAQLIQSEKMASLGELTAGIAHEIQNPLNFVNNFSEVNKELISEMVDEVERGNIGVVKELATDILQNAERIHNHGKRADGIVKAMLQHSSSSSGQKESTDVNALCDEFLRLSYHGLRAKDNSFNAGFKTEFDTTIGNINIVPQDLGRVLLNLINNAFYACDQKRKTADNSYQPIVTVSTKRNHNVIEISVADNGNGIPDAIKGKIFQPFFTTKPTGEGTGLGLSLSYDIVKANRGTIAVSNIEPSGTIFTITLPQA